MERKDPRKVIAPKFEKLGRYKEDIRRGQRGFRDTSEWKSKEPWKQQFR